MELLLIDREKDEFQVTAMVFDATLVNIIKIDLSMLEKKSRISSWITFKSMISLKKTICKISQKIWKSVISLCDKAKIKIAILQLVI